MTFRPARRALLRLFILGGSILVAPGSGALGQEPAEGAPADDERRQEIRARQRLIAHQKRVDVVAERLLNALPEPDRRDLVRYVGVRVADHRADDNRLLYEALGLSRPQHPFVYSVDPTGPGGAAGVQPGDEVLAVAGEEVGDARGFHRRAHRSGAPAPLPLRVLRDGRALDLELTDERRPRGLEVLVAGDGANVYAFANGREIVVSTGMLNLVQTESELAAVLGHEMGHIEKGHFSTTYLDGGGEPYFSQSLEREADRYGVELAFRAGYEASAAADLWERFDARLPREHGAPWLLSHPPNRRRIGDLRALAEELSAR